MKIPEHRKLAYGAFLDSLKRTVKERSEEYLSLKLRLSEIAQHRSACEKLKDHGTKEVGSPINGDHEISALEEGEIATPQFHNREIAALSGQVESEVSKNND